jgi:hypothetical protein
MLKLFFIWIPAAAGKTALFFCFWIPAVAGKTALFFCFWIPACAGKTAGFVFFVSGFPLLRERQPAPSFP